MQLKIPFVDLSNIEIDINLNRIISYEYALRQNVVPIEKTGTTLTLAMVDPTDQPVVDELKLFTKLKIKRITSLWTDIQDAFERLYGKSGCDQTLFDDAVLKVDESVPARCRQESRFDEEAARHADKVVQKILILAMQKNASDIHFETSEKSMKIRFRIDGILQ